MKSIKTKNGFLVIVNENYGCYTDNDGCYRRSVDDLTKELKFVDEKWENKERIDFPHKKSLLKELQYIPAYKNSLVLVD